MTFDQHKPVWEPAHLWLLENTKSDEQKAQAFLESSPPGTQASMPWEEWGTASFRDREGTGVSERMCTVRAMEYNFLYADSLRWLTMNRLVYSFLYFSNRLPLSFLSRGRFYISQMWASLFIITDVFSQALTSLLPMSCSCCASWHYLTLLSGKKVLSLQLLLPLPSLRKAPFTNDLK